MDYLSAKQIKEKYKITGQTLYNWRKAGNVKFVRLPSGKIVYEDLVEKQSKRKNVFYARVSNTKQKEDLERQKSILRAFMTSRGVKVDSEYSDIASGMNESRKEFNKLIKECISGEIGTVYITYKDRLTRFGFGYIEFFLTQLGVKIEVINGTAEEDFQSELTQDLVSILHHFSMKMYSNRRKILKTIQDEISKDINT